MADSDYDDYYSGPDGGDDYYEDSDIGNDSYVGSDVEDDANENSDAEDDTDMDNGYGKNPTPYIAITPKQGLESSNYQKTLKNSVVDKQTGSYTRASQKQSYSSGDVFKERSTGRIGYKDEFKTTSTLRVGDKSGYSEYQREDRYRRVEYGSSSSKEKTTNSNSNKYLK